MNKAKNTRPSDVYAARRPDKSLLLRGMNALMISALTISLLSPVATAQSPGTTGATAPSAGATTAAGPAALDATAKPAEPRAAEQSIGGALLPHDLSPWGMFLHADAIVKTVMVGLAFASLVTWTVFAAKGLELYGARARVRKAQRILAGATTLSRAAEQLQSRTDAASQSVLAAVQEMRLSVNMPGDGLKERIALQLERLELAHGRKMSRGTGLLATIGSTAPFVGLFGTVWGIMNSFIGISNAHTTNLAVVAPGIAEALLATAFGLVAAIPAVVIYNVLARSTAHYRALLGDVSAQVMRLVSRDLDRGKPRLGLAAE